jgi:class 3 adenylate cyclase
MAEHNHDATPKIAFRIGINVGDIIVDGSDIFGDGVNLAARVEGECEPGGVCMSDDAYRQVRGKTSYAFAVAKPPSASAASTSFCARMTVVETRGSPLRFLWNYEAA